MVMVVEGVECGVCCVDVGLVGVVCVFGFGYIVGFLFVFVVGF